MIGRATALAGGIAGAFFAAQLPEFTQQYVQRLGGAVDALQEVADTFDASARTAGLNRASALAQLTGSEFLHAHRQDMTAHFARLANLQSDLQSLQSEGPFMRAYLLPRHAQPDIARATFDAYAPALPVTLAGTVFAVAGFLAGGLAGGTAGRLLGWPWRRRVAKPA